MNGKGNREESLFEGAMGLPTAEARAAFLREACAGDDQLRQRVEALLQVAQPTNDFLEQPPAGASAIPGAPASMLASPTPTINVSPESLPLSEKPGDRIGHYKLLEQIGEGGCGVVYMAEQTEPIRRRVAFKVIKLGMDTKSVVARFEAERQALALMDHPNIAKVLDAGATDTGRPYFVMELVKGIKITDFCDQNHLSTKERLDLFIQVCHAIQHAHQKGIIHRDIKPSNILVTLHDGVPVPKVIDFGIAKATQQPLTDKTMFTAFQQFIGTPAYMSPEQAELSGLDIDTRTDIYALGVLLYELLTGKPPFEPETLMKAGLDEMRRIIRETEPPKPSTKLVTARAAIPHSALSTLRSSATEDGRTPHWKEVRGDLDWIVMKCLDKDRRRRYETANGLAEDILHHLNHEPVEAGAPGKIYRIRKFVRRHRAGVVIGAVVVVLLYLLLGAVIAIVFESKKTFHALHITEAVTMVLDHSLAGLFTRAEDERTAALRKQLLENLDRAAGQVAIKMKDEPEARELAYRALATAYSQLKEHTKSEAMAREALAIRKKLSDADRESPFRQMERVLWREGKLGATEDLLGLGGVLAAAGKLDDAATAYREALELAMKLGAPGRASSVKALTALTGLLMQQRKPSEAEAMLNNTLAAERKLWGAESLEMACTLDLLGNVLWEQKKYAEAEHPLKASLAMHRKMGGAEHPHLPSVMVALALVWADQGRIKEAEEMFREALDLRKNLPGTDSLELACSLDELGRALAWQRRLAWAEQACRESLAMHRKVGGPEHAHLPSVMFRLASVLADQVKLAEAEAIIRETIALSRKMPATDELFAANALNLLGSVLRKQTKLADAEVALRQSLAMYRKAAGTNSPQVVGIMESIALILKEQGKREEAVAVLRERLATQKSLLGPEYAVVGDSLRGLAYELREQKQLAEAEALYREDLSLQQRLHGPKHVEVARSLYNIGWVLKLQEKFPEAESLEREALALRQKTLGPEHPDIAHSLNDLAIVLLDQRKLAEAELLHRQALEMRERILGKEHRDTLMSANNLAYFLKEKGDYAEAESILRETLSAQKRVLGNEHPDVGMSLENLGAVLWKQRRLAESQKVYLQGSLVRFQVAHALHDHQGLQRAITVLTKAIDEKPDSWWGRYDARGFLLGGQGRWQAAVADYAESLRRYSDMPAFALGPLLVEADDQAGYASFRRRLLSQFSGSDDAETAAETAMGMSLVPGESGLATSSQLAESAVTRGTNHVRLPYFQLVKGLVEYRQGRFDSAVEWAQKSLAGSGTNYTTAVSAGAVLAMAQQQLKQTEEARKALSQAAELSETKLPKLESGDLGENWPEWLIARILLREAKGVVETK
jgi:eukaryotic-like serine/threonine-protein kinase